MRGEIERVEKRKKERERLDRERNSKLNKE